ncbi:MAG: M23 family metallopeptidase [Bellilinea sp.]
MARIMGYLVFMILVTGCSSPRESVAPTTSGLPTISAIEAVTPTAAPSTTPPNTPTTAESVELPPEVCSPLAGYALAELAGIVVNPYHPPRLGSDDPHQGVDLAQVDPVNGIALPGMPVQAALAGKVVGQAADRFPYGNMVLIETPLDGAFAVSNLALIVPTPLPERLPPGALTCPDLNSSPPAAGAPRSLYVLYGHMQNRPAVSLGDLVSCGQVLGAIGESGNALNPHLHVEVRVGPPGQTFPSMAHYDPSADYTEMAAYCLWRVSGVYQTIDPGCLWGSCVTP